MPNEHASDTVEQDVGALSSTQDAQPLASRPYCRGDMFLLAALVLAALKLTWHLDHVLDVWFYDETMYLKNGLRLLQQGIVDSSWGPLYSIWYFLLHQLVPDPIALYFRNYAALSVLTTVAVYVYARASNLSQLCSALVSFFWLISFGNIKSWPLPAHFAMGIVLFGLALWRSRRGTSAIPWSVAAACALAAYARPEFAASAVALTLLCLVLAGWRWRAHRRNHPELAKAILLIIFLALLVHFLGNPVSGGRSTQAFVQHFSLNYEKIKERATYGLLEFPEPGSPYWIVSGSKSVEVFGARRPFLQAFAANPAWIVAHVVLNAMHTVPEFVSTLFVHHTLLFPAWSRLMADAEGVLLLAIFTGIVLAAVRARRRSGAMRDATVRDGNDPRLLQWAVLACVLLPAFAVILCVYPRPHYLIIPGVILIVAGLELSPVCQVRAPLSSVKALILGTVLLMLVPRVEDAWYFAPDDMLPSRPQPNATMLRALRALPLSRTKEIRLAEAQSGVDAYLWSNVTSVAAWRYGSHFASWMNTHKVNAVLVTDMLRVASKAEEDPEFVEFVRNAPSRGYVKYDLPTGNYLLIRADRTQ